MSGNGADKMKNNTALYVFVCIIMAILLVALAFDEKEIRNCKANETAMQEKIATLEKQNSDLTEELQAVRNRAEKAESELAEYTEQASAQINPQAYIYHDPQYDEMSAKDYIAWRESGGDYNAQNGQYYGKYQLQIDMLGGDLSPENQEETAERYIMERYGSWENAREFWNNNGWY